MQKVKLRASCGHTFEIELSGSLKKQKERVLFLEEKGLCPSCYKRREGDRELETAKLLELSLGGLPDMLGTEKQVSWARRIRGQMVAAFLDEYSDEIDLKGLGEAIRSRVPGSEVFSERKASYWIEHRNLGLNTIMKNWKAEKEKNRDKIAIG